MKHIHFSSVVTSAAVVVALAGLPLLSFANQDASSSAQMMNEANGGVHGTTTMSAREEAARMHREDIRARIAELKDQRKRAIAEHIMSQLDRINQVWTRHFREYLNHLSAILAKIARRAEKVHQKGVDISGVESAIQTASSSIATARTAVDAQAQKTYSIVVATSTSATSTESVLRDAFKAARNQLHSDLTLLRDGAIRSARDAVKAAFQALRALPHANGEDNSTTTTSTATSS